MDFYFSATKNPPKDSGHKAQVPDFLSKLESEVTANPQASHLLSLHVGLTGLVCSKALSKFVG